jgi:hypothetical protein
MEEKAIVKVGTKGLAFQDVEGLWRFATMVAESSDMCPKGYINSPKKIVVAIQMGAEVGMTPMKALQSIAVINGRATVWGDAALGMVKASGLCDYVKEKVEGKGDKMVATVESKRKDCDEPVITTFDVEQAKQAKLWGKSGTWTTHPYRMLKYKARAFNLRDNFPDILGGFHITEEMQFPDPEYQPTTPRREERKQVENTAIAIPDDKKNRMEDLLNRFVAVSGVEDAEQFRIYAAKQGEVDEETLASPDGWTEDVLAKVEISLEEWENARRERTYPGRPLSRPEIRCMPLSGVYRY